jgi:hypothetical protein
VYVGSQEVLGMSLEDDEEEDVYMFAIDPEKIQCRISSRKYRRVVESATVLLT